MARRAQLPQVGLLYSQLLLLAAFGGLIAYGFAWGPEHPARGLYVLCVPKSWLFTHNPCERSWTVSVKSNGTWYLDSLQIAPDQLPMVLRSQMGNKKTCVVFFEADPDVPYADAIRAIDLIEQISGRVALSTPQAKNFRNWQ
jgi:hypothetical protein